jgi:hypothetical protein
MKYGHLPVSIHLRRRQQVTPLHAGGRQSSILPWFAQHATVTAILADGSGNTSPQAFIHCEPYNCGYNFPTVSNSAITAVRTVFDIKPVSPSATISIAAGPTTASTPGCPN